jgi:SAM-dependent methyltransferase
VLDSYVRSAPSPQTAVDIFAGEWASKLPPPFESVTAGIAPLHSDARLVWGLQVLGGVTGQSVLELGPLEAGHTYLLDRAGAASVVAVEGSTRAYLKCLITKELLGLPSARFLCGDFVAFLAEQDQRFDLCVASGVLYHMTDPVGLLQRISRVAPRVYLWTHYYDAECFRGSVRTAHRVVPPEDRVTAGLAYRVYRHEYGRALDSSGFCGGSAPQAYWMERDAILAALRHFGYDRVETAWEQRDHLNGPAFSVAAWRSSIV